MIWQNKEQVNSCRDHDCTGTGSVNFVQSSLKHHPLRVTLYKIANTKKSLFNG